MWYNVSKYLRIAFKRSQKRRLHEYLADQNKTDLGITDTAGGALSI